MRKSWLVPAPPKYQMTLLSSDSPVWKTAATPTPRQLRLPRSERLKEMRALAEKVLGIGTVESRRRKPRVTGAAAQATEVEPASKFHVERPDKPDDLDAPPRQQSEATVVGDTIHTGAIVANIKRRKRKPKSTEPAGDAG